MPLLDMEDLITALMKKKGVERGIDAYVTYVACGC